MVRVRVVCVLANSSHVPLLSLLTPVLFQHEKWLISVSDFRQVLANSQLVLQIAVVGSEKGQLRLAIFDQEKVFRDPRSGLGIIDPLTTLSRSPPSVCVPMSTN